MKIKTTGISRREFLRFAGYSAAGAAMAACGVRQTTIPNPRVCVDANSKARASEQSRYAGDLTSKFWRRQRAE